MHVQAPAYVFECLPCLRCNKAAVTYAVVLSKRLLGTIFDYIFFFFKNTYINWETQTFERTTHYMNLKPMPDKDSAKGHQKIELCVKVVTLEQNNKLRKGLWQAFILLHALQLRLDFKAVLRSNGSEMKNPETSKHVHSMCIQLKTHIVWLDCYIALFFHLVPFFWHLSFLYCILVHQIQLLRH